jgi:hypothetical protein
MLQRSFSMVRAQRCGQFSGHASNWAFRDYVSMSVFAFSNRSQITQVSADLGKTESMEELSSRRTCPP